MAVVQGSNLRVIWVGLLGVLLCVCVGRGGDNGREESKNCRTTMYHRAVP